jgi:hypothetical protein
MEEYQIIRNISIIFAPGAWFPPHRHHSQIDLTNIRRRKNYLVGLINGIKARSPQIQSMRYRRDTIKESKNEK